MLRSSVANPRLAAAALLAAAWLQAQDLRLLDRSTLVAATYDAARQRLLGLDALGNTLEFDGSSWRQRPIPRLDGVEGQLVFSQAAWTTLFVGIDANRQFLMLRLRGDAWEPIVTATTPIPLRDFALGYDGQRQEVVLFGGRTMGFAFVADTWVYDGVDWRLRTPVTRPPARSDAACAYDALRGRFVVYSGQSSGPLVDTWEWDGTDWLLRSATSPPGMMWYASMAYDPLRRRSCLIGIDPMLGTTVVHEWNGTIWQARQPVGQLPVRTEATALFDPGLGEIVVTGGSGGGTGLLDTWSYDGSRWLLRDGPDQPRERGTWTAVARPGGGVLLLTGLGGPDTWAWNGSSWQVLGGPQPPFRISAAAAAGPAAAFVFGGYGDQSQIRDDFWRFDGVAWTQLPAGPANHLGGGLAHDWLRNLVVLFGGGPPGAPTGDTWTFDGVAWQQRQLAPAPGPRILPRLAFDPTTGNTVLFGGFDAQNRPRADTWRFDGAQWTPVPSVLQPVPQGTTSLAFDATRGRVVLTDSFDFGTPLDAWTLEANGWQAVALGDVAITGPLGSLGSHKRAVGATAGGGLLLVDDDNLFQLDPGQARVRTVGVPCTPAAAVLAATRHARPGASDFALEASNLASGAFALVVFDIAGTPAPVLGCTLHVQPSATRLVGASAAGTARLSLPLPASPSLRGGSLWSQAATLDPNAPAGVTFSAALALTVGS